MPNNPMFISTVNPATGLQADSARRTVYPYDISTVNPASTVVPQYGLARIRPPVSQYAAMPKSFQEVTREDQLRRKLVESQLSTGGGVVMPMDGCGCGMNGLGDAAPPAEAVQVAKEVLDLFEKQRARARSKYNSMVNSIKAQVKDDVECVRKYQASSGYKNYVKNIRATMPDPNNIPAVFEVAGAVLRYLKVDPALYRVGTNCAVLDSKGKQVLTHGPALAVYLYAQRAMAPAQRLQKLARLLNPISDAQMLSEIKAGQFKIFTDSCGHKFVHSNGELAARSLSDVDEDWKEMYYIKCPGKSTWDMVKELAVPAAIMIAVPAAINYLATGAVGWAGSAATGSGAAAAATPAAAAAATPIATATPAAAAAISAPAAAAAAAPAAAPLISTLTTAATQAASAVPAIMPLITGGGSPVAVPEEIPAETAAPASGAGSFMVPALIAGGLLLLAMKG